MRSVLTLLGALVVLIATSCGGSDQSSEVRSVAWLWSGVLEGEDSIGLAPTPDPASYLLRLDDDGSFIAKADCKSVAGTYVLSGSELRLELGPTPKRTCGKGSWADKYTALLRRVATYEIHDEGALALGLEDGGGYMYFYTRPS